MLRIKSPRSLLLLPLTALAIAGSPTLVIAGESDGQQTIHVKDYDLTKHDDVVRLYSQIGNVATAVCGGESRTGSLLASPSEQACVKRAVDDTVARIHNDQLTAYHQQRSGDPKLADRGGTGGKSGKVDANHN
jgi:UrcA family protein